MSRHRPLKSWPLALQPQRDDAFSDREEQDWDAEGIFNAGRQLLHRHPPRTRLWLVAVIFPVLVGSHDHDRWYFMGYLSSLRNSGFRCDCLHVGLNDRCVGPKALQELHRDRLLKLVDRIKRQVFVLIVGRP